MDACALCELPIEGAQYARGDQPGEILCRICYRCLEMAEHPVRAVLGHDLAANVSELSRSWLDRVLDQAFHS